MFDPENDIERQLVAAADGIGGRGTFASNLLDATVYVAMLGDFSKVQADDDGKVMMPTGMTLNLLSIRKDDADWLAFFTSPKRIFAATQDAHACGPDVARDLFQRHPGVRFLLNPGSDYGKEFLPGEIADMLAGKLVADGPVEYPAGTQMLIGRPSDYPTAFVEKVRNALGAMPDVEAGYLAFAVIGGRGSLLLEMISKTDQSALAERLMSQIRPGIPHGRPLDIRVSPSVDVAITAGSVEPFYQRKRGFFSRFFS